MASISRRGDGWRAQIYRAGTRESRTFATRAEAADWAALREAEIVRGEATGSAHTFARAVERYRESVVPLMRSQRSELARLAIISRHDWASRPLRDLTPGVLSAWRDARLKSASAGTVLREMTTIRGVLEYARRDLGWLSSNPISEVRRPPEPPDRHRLISDAERDALLSAWGWEGRVETVAHEAACALLVALETAMRAGEILGLEWSRVDLDKRVARLERTKNGDRREVPLSTRAVELLRLMQGRRLAHVRAPRADGRIWHIDVDTLGVLFRRARADAGIDDVRFHDSRATAITRLSRILGPLELARMIGHRDLGSLLIYYRETAESLAGRLG